MKVQCKRCGYKWLTREDRTPRRCPKCSSYSWQTPKKVFPQ